MIEINIEISNDSISSIIELLNYSNTGLTGAALPNTAAAFSKAQQSVAQAWRDYVSGDGSLEGLKPFSEYKEPNTNVSRILQSIKDRSFGDFNKSVYSTSEELKKISDGTPDVEYDMKKTHPYGNKSRISKKGIPYLIINFRWGTPNEKGTKRRWNNVIPQKQYNEVVKGMGISYRTDKVHPELNAKGDAIDRSEYKWKSRLTETQAWSDRSKGLVRMKNGTKSTYFTFRVISAKSPADSWIYKRKGKEGIDIIGALERQFKEPISEMIAQAIETDEKELQSLSNIDSK